MGHSGIVFRVLCPKISTGQEKLAPPGLHGLHVFAPLSPTHSHRRWVGGPLSLKAGNFSFQARTALNYLWMGKFGTNLESGGSQEAPCTAQSSVHPLIAVLELILLSLQVASSQPPQPPVSLHSLRQPPVQFCHSISCLISCLK